MEHSLSREANRSSESEEIPCNLLNPKIHYLIHKLPSPVPTQNQKSPVHSFPSHSLKIPPPSKSMTQGIYVISLHNVELYPQQYLCPPCFQTKVSYALIPLPTCNTYPPHHNLSCYTDQKICAQWRLSVECS